MKPETIDSIEEADFVLGQLEVVVSGIKKRVERFEGSSGKNATSGSAPAWYRGALHALRNVECTRKAVLHRKKQLLPAVPKGNPLAFEMFYLAARDVLEQGVLDSIFAVINDASLPAVLDGCAGRAG